MTSDILPPNAQNNEQELLLRVAEGDEAAFKELFGLFRNDVYMHSLTYTKSPEFSEELVLDIFLKVWNNRSQLTDIKHFKNYLFILSKNHIISAMRKRLVDGKAMTSLEQLKEEVLQPFRHLEARETERLLLKTIDNLPQQQRTAFTLSRMENKTYDEIASIMGITRRTVNFHIVQALNTLRDALYNKTWLSILFYLFTSRFF